MKTEIIPAILSKTPTDYHKKFKAVEPLVDWIQVDIVDNKFARNLTVGPKAVGAIRTRKKLEIHLMVELIENWIDPFIKIRPTTNVSRIIVPLESARDPIGITRHLKRHGVEIGFSLNPETKVERLQHVIDKVDTVLLLSVYPGFSGQHFVHGTLDKIMQLREMRPDIMIEVDGGIEPGTARKCAEVGANILISNSFIFEHERKRAKGSIFEHARKGDTKSIFENKDVEGDTYHEKVRNALGILKEDVEGIVPSI